MCIQANEDKYKDTFLRNLIYDMPFTDRYKADLTLRQHMQHVFDFGGRLV